MIIDILKIYNRVKDIHILIFKWYDISLETHDEGHIIILTNYRGPLMIIKSVWSNKSKTWLWGWYSYCCEFFN